MNRPTKILPFRKTVPHQVAPPKVADNAGSVEADFPRFREEQRRYLVASRPAIVGFCVPAASK